MKANHNKSMTRKFEIQDQHQKWGEPKMGWGKESLDYKEELEVQYYSKRADKDAQNVFNDSRGTSNGER